MKLDVLFRSCSRIHAVHGQRRVVNAEKSEIVLRCLNSLIRSMGLAGGPDSTALALTVIDDHSDPECVERMRALLRSSPFPTRFIPLEDTGNGPSLLANYEHARANAEDLIYFVEDDYLHLPDAVRSLLGAHQHLSFGLKQDVVLFPCDNPQLYQGYNPSGVLLGENRYWRNVGSTTGTFFLRKKTLLEHWDKYLAFSRYGLDPGVHESNTIDLVYRTVPCFSPMPSLTVHLADTGCISPFLDWTALWQKNALPDRQPVNEAGTVFRDALL